MAGTGVSVDEIVGDCALVGIVTVVGIAVLAGGEGGTLVGVLGVTTTMAPVGVGVGVYFERSTITGPTTAVTIATDRAEINPMMASHIVVLGSPSFLLTSMSPNRYVTDQENHCRPRSRKRHRNPVLRPILT